MLVKWYRVSVWDPYDAKNAMNKTFGLLLIEPQIEAFMLLVMLKILEVVAGERRLSFVASSAQRVLENEHTPAVLVM